MTRTETLQRITTGDFIEIVTLSGNVICGLAKRENFGPIINIVGPEDQDEGRIEIEGTGAAYYVHADGFSRISAVEIH